MEKKIKIMIVPSLNSGWDAQQLGERLAGLGYEIKLIEGAFGEIVGLRELSKSDYRAWKPDLVMAIGIGCITVGTFVNAMRIMINPDFHYSDFLKEWVHKAKRDCEDAEYDARVAERLESKENSLRGEKPMLGIFTYESEDIADYKERYGDYEEYFSLDLHKSESLDFIAERIERFLKETGHI